MSIITIITDHLMSTRISSPSPHKPTNKNMASLLGSSQLAQIQEYFTALNVLDSIIQFKKKRLAEVILTTRMM